MAERLPITIDELPDLLGHISPNVDHDTWVQVAMGVKAEFGDAGFDPWDTWSKDGKSYKAETALSVWKSCKGGKVGFGTVVHLARDGGWKPRKTQLTAEERRKRKADDEARRKKREAELLADEARKLAMQLQVQAATHRLLAEFTAARGKSEYLDRKQAPAFGVRFVTRPVLLSVDDQRQVCELWSGDGIRQYFDALPKERPDHISFRLHKPGEIIMPLADLDGQVWSYQSINSTGTKLFPKYARKQGCCHWVGRADPMPVIALAEGYATAASVYQAMEWPTVVCVDVGNMAHIARGVRERFPYARLVIAGDDDPKPDGSNPGRVQAEALALELGAVAVFPQVPAQAGEAA